MSTTAAPKKTTARKQTAAKAPARKRASDGGPAAAVGQKPPAGGLVDGAQVPTAAAVEAITGAGEKVADLTPEQLGRAMSHPAGLRKKALAIFVLEGKTTATQIAEGRAAAAASSPRASRKAGQRRSQYPDEITEAVRLAKAARGTSMGAPGAKQHVLVREHLNGRKPTDVVGMSVQKLRDAASGKMTTEQLRTQTKLREFGASIPDQFCRGRNLASILVAVVDQAK